MTKPRSKPRKYKSKVISTTKFLRQRHKLSLLRAVQIARLLEGQDGYCPICDRGEDKFVEWCKRRKSRAKKK